MSEPQSLHHPLLSRDAFGRLQLQTAAGLLPVNPVRAHPISAPEAGISLVGADGHELAWVAQLAELPEPVRSLLREELAAREFQPELQRILKVSTFSTPSQWTVQTDRGETDFILKTEEDIRRLGEGRLLITASHGVQFQLRDRFALDRASRRILERFL